MRDYVKSKGWVGMKEGKQVDPTTGMPKLTTEETKPVEREAAFTEIMGRTMPRHDSPEYEKWMFDQAWDAALERAAALLEEEVDEAGGYADGVIGLVRSLAAQIRALKGSR